MKCKCDNESNLICAGCNKSICIYCSMKVIIDRYTINFYCIKCFRSEKGKQHEK